MVIKTMAIVIFLFVSISAFVSSSGWIKADERAKREYALNKKLSEDNARLRAVMSFNKLQKDLEEEKDA